MLSNLESCSFYQLNIYANEITSNEQESVFINTTLFSPGPVKNLIYTDLYPTNVSISWDPPDENQNCVGGYRVYWEESQSKTIESSYTIVNLEPCVEYKIQVCVLDIEGKEGSCESIQITMDVDNSDEIRSPIITFTSEGVTVVDWKKPLYAAECIIKYRILITINDLLVDEAEVVEPTVVIYNLTACEIYGMQIVPVNKNFGDGRLLRFDLETGVKYPGPPEPPILLHRMESSLQLSSEYYDESNACKISFGRFICQEYDSAYNVTRGHVSIGTEIKQNQTYNIFLYLRYSKLMYLFQEQIENLMEKFSI